MGYVKKEIKVQKTARYFLSGELTKETKEVVFVLHGYGQLASYFIQNFTDLASNTRLIVAPEGLSKFYWEGLSGRVVASWMTKEDRELEIEDYIAYLDAIISELNLINKKVKITLLGFSQGATTAIRWLVHTKKTIFNKLIVWAGGFPFDVFTFPEAKKLEHLKINFVLGDKDEYISKEKAHELITQLTHKGLTCELLFFNGEHKIDRKTLTTLF